MPPLQNLYYERRTATARPCYICRNQTTTVLATIDTRDFLYVCEKHLSDPATLIPQPSSPSVPSKEDITKVIEEHKAREIRRGDKIKEKEKEKESDANKTTDDKDKDADKDKDQSKPASSIPSYGPPPTQPSTGIPTSNAPPASKHKQYALHRGIFTMREREVRGREQGVKAKEVGKGLPQVPRGNF